jgi:magnesium transporter
VEILDHVDRSRIEALLAKDEFFWLDLVDADTSAIEQLGSLLDIHAMAIEDTLEFGQRPKLDEYPGRVLLVYYGVHHGSTGDPAEGRPIEVHMHISGSWIVTVRPGACRDLHQLKDRLKDRDGEAEEYIVYRILDALTDSFFPLLDQMDNEIDSLEDAMMQGVQQQQLHRLFALKRELVTLRRIVTPQRDLLASGGDLISRIPGLTDDKTHDYFRDVYDHLIRISDLIDSYRDLLSGALDVYLSTQSNRMNQVMKQLTVIATIFLPLTFVTGFFGQNFAWLVRHIDSWEAFLILGIGGVIVPVLLMVWYFRARGWTSNE